MAGDFFKIEGQVVATVNKLASAVEPLHNLGRGKSSFAIYRRKLVHQLYAPLPSSAGVLYLSQTLLVNFFWQGTIRRLVRTTCVSGWHSLIPVEWDRPPAYAGGSDKACYWYQALRLSGSLDLKKIPPIPITRFISFSLLPTKYW